MLSSRLLELWLIISKVLRVKRSRTDTELSVGKAAICNKGDAMIANENQRLSWNSWVFVDERFISY